MVNRKDIRRKFGAFIFKQWGYEKRLGLGFAFCTSGDGEYFVRFEIMKWIIHIGWIWEDLKGNRIKVHI